MNKKFKEIIAKYYEDDIKSIKMSDMLSILMNMENLLNGNFSSYSKLFFERKYKRPSRREINRVKIQLEEIANDPNLTIISNVYSPFGELEDDIRILKKYISITPFLILYL